jgi:uncharacterized membrane protein YhdT
MKTFNLYFKISSFLAISCWMFLIFFPRLSFSHHYIILITVGLLCFSYGFLLVKKNHDNTIYPKGNFSTLEGVCDLFKNPKSVLIGWIHYLAFDLMVGLYIKNQALEVGIPHWLQIPCFVLTLLFGPLGLLLFFLIRMFYI